MTNGENAGGSNSQPTVLQTVLALVVGLVALVKTRGEQSAEIAGLKARNIELLDRVAADETLTDEQQAFVTDAQNILAAAQPPADTHVQQAATVEPNDDHPIATVTDAQVTAAPVVTDASGLASSNGS